MSASLCSWLLILITVFLFIIQFTLADETLCLLAMPPTPSFDDLPDRGVVISLTYIELKVIASLLRLDTLITVIQNLVHLLHQPNIHRKEKVGLLQLWPVKLHTVAFGHLYIEVLQ